MVELKYIGHACVLATFKGTSILTDPWFSATINFGLLHAFPKFDGLSDEEMLTVSAIHLSHLHSDHYCEKTLARFRRDIPVIIAKHRDGVFREKLEGLGFSDVIEVPHGPQGVQFGSWRVHVFVADRVYPYNSSLVLLAGDDAYSFDNDARFSNEHYFWLKKYFPIFVAAFVGYADIYPYLACMDFSEYAGLGAGQMESEIFDFAEDQAWQRIEAICKILEPRWVVPYAAGLRFLNEDTVQFNRTIFDVDGLLSRNVGLAIPVHLNPGQKITGDQLPSPYWTSLATDFGQLLPPIDDESITGNDIRERGDEFKTAYLKMVAAESKVWTSPMRIQIEVRGCAAPPFTFGIYFDGQTVAFATFEDPDVRIAYKAVIVARFLTREWSFADLHYSYRFKVFVRRIVAGQLGVHRWGLSAY